MDRVQETADVAETDLLNMHIDYTEPEPKHEPKHEPRHEHEQEQEHTHSVDNDADDEDDIGEDEDHDAEQDSDFVLTPTSARSISPPLSVRSRTPSPVAFTPEPAPELAPASPALESLPSSQPRSRALSSASSATSAVGYDTADTIYESNVSSDNGFRGLVHKGRRHCIVMSYDENEDEKGNRELVAKLESVTESDDECDLPKLKRSRHARRRNIVMDDEDMDDVPLVELCAQAKKAAEAVQAQAVTPSSTTTQTLAVAPSSTTLLTQTIAIAPPATLNLDGSAVAAEFFEKLRDDDYHDSFPNIIASLKTNPAAFPLLIDSKEETMCMPTNRDPFSTMKPHPEAQRLHPHALDNAVSDGDHLLVHQRKWNSKTGNYDVSRKSQLKLNAPRGRISCRLARKVPDMEKEWMTVGMRASSRRAGPTTTTNNYNNGADDETAPLTLEQQMAKPYLSYHGVTLTHDDVHVLRSDWLTDNNITFWEEYLEHEILPKYPQARIELLRASFSLVLMAQKIDTAREALPKFKDITHIFLPISDAALADMRGGSRRTTDAGSHWSLLLISVIDGVAFHYDSMNACNLRAARNVTARMAVLLGRPLRFRDIEDTPQQANGNDCGVFVCVLMRFLLVKRLLNAHAREKVSMSLGGKMIDAQGGRQEMLRIIENLRREGERRRSASPFAKKEVPRIE